MNKIKAAIIEDEIPAARLLKDTLLSLRPDWEVQLLPGNIEEAVEWFGQHPHPDILFLDIQLTDGNSFLFIEQAHPESMIVFTTAYDEYAVRAFSVNSIDYLLKPIHEDRLMQTILRFEGLTNMSKEKYIAYCGAVSYDKDGVNILVEAFSKFHRTHQDYRLYIIGKGIDHNVINKLKWLAQKEEVEDAVVFTGSIPPSEMPQMLYDASILALSRPDNLQAQNGFPTKLGEYLATGKPVVVTGVGEIGVNGYLSEPNSDSFADKLSYVADHYSEALNVGCEGKKLSQEAFNYRTQCNVVRNVMNDYYKELKISAFNRWEYKGNLKGFFFIVCYRIAHFFTQNKALYLIGTPVWLLYRFIFRWMLGIDVPERVILGSNCRVCHGIGLVIHPGVVIGDNVKLHQNTTIGIVNGGQPPRLGSNIIIGANSVIIGNIKIGDGAIVGAGAVVTKDVPQNAVVVGNPARIIKYRNLE